MKVDVSLLTRRHPEKRRLYRQFKDRIRGAIVQGFYRSGERIETERDFMATGKLSYPTVSRALRELAKEGWLVRKGGAGTFVAPDPPHEIPLKKIGVFYYSVETPYFHRVFEGISAECARQGITPLPVATGLSEQGELTALNHLRECKADAVIGLPMGSFRMMREMASLAQREFPVVLVGTYFDEVACDSVSPDSENGARAAVRHLLDLGHRHFGFLGIMPRYPFSTMHAQILRGIRAELATAVPPAAPLREVHLPLAFNEHDKEAQSRTLDLIRDEGKGRPSAIVCEADGLAARYLYGLLAEEGLNVPGDVSVVGFGDIANVWNPTPLLTSVAWPLRRMGENAVRLLVSRATMPRRIPVRMVLDAPLAVRASTGPAPDKRRHVTSARANASRKSG